MPPCIHRLCERGTGCPSWRSFPHLRLHRLAFAKARRRGIARAISSLSPEFEDFRPQQQGISRVAEDPMKKILEEFDLDVSMLFRDAEEHNMQQLEKGWDEEAQMYDWEKPIVSEELANVFDGTEESEWGYDDSQDLQELQADRDFQALQQKQMEDVYDKAFELHHEQMARSTNPYATTLYYAQHLEDISKIDEAGETSDIPGWIRAIFVMERTFDEWNEQVREQLALGQERLAKDFQAKKLQEYRDSVSELQGDFDYSQLTFATSSHAEEEAQEDLSGTGDKLEPLLNVLPGLDGEAQAQAAEFAAEVMGGAAGDSEEALFDEDEEEEEENVIDF